MKKLVTFLLLLLLFPATSLAATKDITPPSLGTLNELLQARANHLTSVNKKQVCKKGDNPCKKRARIFESKTKTFNQQIATARGAAYSELESLAAAAEGVTRQEFTDLLNQKKAEIEAAHATALTALQSFIAGENLKAQNIYQESIRALKTSTEEKIAVVKEGQKKRVSSFRELGQKKKELRQIKQTLGGKSKLRVKQRIQKINTRQKKLGSSLKENRKLLGSDGVLRKTYKGEKEVLVKQLAERLQNLEQERLQKTKALEEERAVKLSAAEAEVAQALQTALDSLTQQKAQIIEQIQALDEEESASKANGGYKAAGSLPEDFFGVMSQEPIPGVEAREMAAGGISIYRIPMSWDTVQASSTHSFNWQGWDAQVRDLAAANIEVLPIMMGTPAGFADKYSTFPIFTEEQRQGWATYLREAIKRYGPKGTFWQENKDLPYLPVRTWQIWNEANWLWFAYPVSPENYTELLKNSYKIIKEADPGAQVMLTSMFAEPGNEPGKKMPATKFLSRIYQLGGKAYFDSASLNPYDKNAEGMARSVKAFREVMNNNQDNQKNLHITEVGWGSGSNKEFNETGSEKAQAKELLDGYRFLLQNRVKLNIRSIYWFSWKDLPASNTGACKFCYNTGFFRAGPGGELVAKPSWKAFKTITNKHSGR